MKVTKVVTSSSDDGKKIPVAVKKSSVKIQTLERLSGRPKAKMEIRDRPNASVLNQLDLANSSGLVYVGGAAFGRNIEALLGRMKSGVNGYWITLRNKPTAVVLPSNEFEELVSIREKYQAIINEQSRRSVQSAQSEFEDLFAQMQSKKSAAAMRNMVNVTGNKLAESYKPGRTETK